MAASKQDLIGWAEAGVRDKHDYMFVICDTFDYEDYPHYFDGTPDGARIEYSRQHGPNMQRVMEVYWLKGDLKEQLARHRCLEYGEQKPGISIKKITVKTKKKIEDLTKGLGNA